MYDVLRLALALVKQLPDTHEGRNNFVMNHGDCEESRKFKVEKILCNTSTSLDEKIAGIQEVYEVRDTCSPAPQMPQAPHYGMGPGAACKPHDSNRW
jgi:hypothetical protein